MNIQAPQRLIIGISGASGAIYGVRLLQALAPTAIETHLIVSRAGEITLSQETAYKSNDLKPLANHHYRIDDIAARPASGSFRHDGMIIAPCSVRLLSTIAMGVGDNLLARAADVTLKERRRLVLMLRETPLSLNHIKAMQALTEMGAIIAPPVPAFYNQPQSIDDLVNHSIGRVLDLFDIDLELVKRWRE